MRCDKVVLHLVQFGLQLVKLRICGLLGQFVHIHQGLMRIFGRIVNFGQSSQLACQSINLFLLIPLLHSLLHLELNRSLGFLQLLMSIPHRVVHFGHRFQFLLELADLFLLGLLLLLKLFFEVLVLFI